MTKLPFQYAFLNPLSKAFFSLLIFVWVLMCVPNSVNAQSMADISSIKVDDLTDAQIQELIRRANEAGLTEFELIQMARLRGVPETELEKLRNRIENMEFTVAGGRTGTTPSKREPRRQTDLSEISQGLFQVPNDFSAAEDAASPYFGGDIFYNKRRKLSFEPNLNIATPKNYVLGPGDLLYVDVYGQSEKYYEANISADGFILLDNIGPVSVSGKTIEEATHIIRTRLSTFFADMKGPNPSTFMQVTLGNVRTIKVHLVGELRLPGTFTLSAFSTVFNALYAAGGPSDNGTMREIKVLRNNKTAAVLDIYDFLVNGNANLNFQLQDQDVVLVAPFISRVTVTGEVKRPKIFEVKEGESFAQLLAYAGGFTDEAFQDRVSVTRILGSERAVSDIFKDQFGIFTIKGGDQYNVGKVLNRFSNRVQIKGAVFRDGNYALTEEMTLRQLIKNAEGLRGDAFLDRATILRTYEDLTTELIQVNLREVMAGAQSDVKLKREDVVRISSLYDLQEEYYVQINGEVKNPGTFPYSKQMTVEDLIILAGGLKESANANDVEIARRSTEGVGTFSELIPVKINTDLSLQESPQYLLPFDNVSIRRKANFVLDKQVQVEGQVNSPGIFSIKNAEERVSDVIRRAGGLTQYAYPNGATLIRRTEFFETESEQIRRQRSLQDLQQKMLLDPNNTEAQELLLQRLFKDLGTPMTAVAGEGALAAQNKREALTGIIETKSDLGTIKIKQTEAVAIDLEAILQNPGSDKDLILEEGDIISIPRQLQTVRLRGDVVYPATVRFEKDRGMKFYISRAGGFDIRANRKRTYVVYANGEVDRTKSFLGIRSYPKVAPGAEVIVPTKGPRMPLRPGEIVGIATALATLVLVITQINP